VVGTAAAICVLARHRAVSSSPAGGTRAATSLLVESGTVVADGGTRAPRTIVSTSRTLVVAEFLRAPSGTALALGTRRTLQVRLLTPDIAHGRVVAHHELGVGRIFETGFFERVADVVGAADVCGAGPDHRRVVTTLLAVHALGRLVRVVGFLVVPQLDGER